MAFNSFSPPQAGALPASWLRRAGAGAFAWTKRRRLTANRKPVSPSHHVPVVFALPSYAALAILLVFPFVYTIALAVTQSTLGAPFADFAGIDNFRQALESQAFMGSLGRTTIFALSAAVLETLFGIAIALLLQARGAGFGAIGTILLLPMVTPPIMVGVGWQMLLAPAGGGLTGLWSALGIAGFNAFGSGTAAFVSLVLIEVWQWTPFVVLMVYVALLGVDQEQIEASMLDGANLWRRFRAVIYPAIAPVTLSVLLLRILGGFKAFDVAYVITQGGPGFSTTFSSFQIFRTALDGAYDTGVAAAETLLFGLLIGVVTFGVTLVRKRATRISA